MLQYGRGKVDRTMSAKFSERDLKKGVPDKDNCFVFATPDGQLLLRVDGSVFPFTSEEEFNDLLRQYFRHKTFTQRSWSDSESSETVDKLSEGTTNTP